MSFDEEIQAERARQLPGVRDRTLADDVADLGGSPDDPELWSLAVLEDGLAERIAGMVEPKKWQKEDWIVRYSWPDGTHHVWTSDFLRWKSNWSRNGAMGASLVRDARRTRKALRKHAVGDQAVLVGETESGNTFYVFRDGFVVGEGGFRPHLKHVARLFA